MQRRRYNTLLLVPVLGMMVLALSIFWGASAHAQEDNCAQQVAELALEKADKATVVDIQERLHLLGFSPGGIDGKFGSRTKAALQSFCREAHFAVGRDLSETLLNQVAINAAYPRWVDVLVSKEFEEWAQRQPDALEIKHTLASGNSSSMIALLDRYYKQRTYPPSSDDSSRLISYALTESGIEILRSRSKTFESIAALLAKSYASKDEFDSALKEVIKGVAEPEQFVQAIERHAPAQLKSEQTTATLEKLQSEAVPEYVLAALASGQLCNSDLANDGEPAPPADADDEVVLACLADKAVAFKSQIADTAEVSSDGAKLTQASLTKFASQHKNDQLAVAVLARLKKIKDINYKNKEALAWAVKVRLMKMAEEIRGFSPAVSAAAETAALYGFSEEAVSEIKDILAKTVVPEVYLELITHLQGVDYPNEALFWHAVKAKVAIAGSNNIFRQAIFDAIDKHAANKIDQIMLDDMKADNVPPAVLAQLGNLLGREFANTQMLKAEVEGVFRQLSGELDQYRATITSAAMTTHEFHADKTIQWNGESCGCVKSNLAGEIYGIFPYWLAGDEQKIDFSLLTRVGYYGLGFDDKGYILNSERWSHQPTGFIDAARTFRSKVDLVIHRKDWKTWEQMSTEEKMQAFARLADGITGLLDIPLDDFASRAKPFISLGLAAQPVRGDGVTLYFEDYPQDASSVDAFTGLIRVLKLALAENGRSQSINIMFRSAEMGTGIYDYHKLLNIIDTIQGDGDEAGGLFLVLLQEPTTLDKKLLRSNIENGLQGKDRMKLLRQVTTVLSYDGHTEKQLDDDVIYANNNFGGIGFWPLPGAQGSAVESEINRSLNENFLKSENAEASDKPAVCNYICPNRWVFRVAWDIFLVILLVSVIRYFINCEWRSVLDRHFLYFIAVVVAPFIFLTLALLFCDPVWEEVSRGNAPLILVVVAILTYAIWRYRENKRLANLP